LYDYYQVPSAAYFASKKACELLHVQYSYDDNSVAVVNGYDHVFTGMMVKAAVYNIDGKQVASQAAALDIPADVGTTALQLDPLPYGISPAYFLKLELRDETSKLVSDNFYWLSTKPDVIDWANSVEDYYTPESAYADLTELESLPQVKLKTSGSISRSGEESTVRTVVENPSSSVAFMVHLRLANAKTDDDVAPIFWDDNYVTLLPGEKREVTAKLVSGKSQSDTLMITVDGWNVMPAGVTLSMKGVH
jgi:exo-1,4-beta-D-glucosaminidase